MISRIVLGFQSRIGLRTESLALFSTVMVCGAFVVSCSQADTKPVGAALASEDLAAEVVPPTAPVVMSQLENGEKAYAQCRACHALTADAGMRMGPHLENIVGRLAGSIDGYDYSEVFTNSTLVWTREELDAFLASPQAHSPGTKMLFAGVSREETREALIKFLENDIGG